MLQVDDGRRLIMRYPVPFLGGLRLLLMLALAVGCAAAAAPPTQAYREAVLRTAAGIGPQAKETARTAYAAIDGGADSAEARDIGGIDVAHGYVARFERTHDYGVLRDCVFAKLAPGEAAKRQLHERLAASEQYAALIRDAERLASAEFSQTLAAMPQPVLPASRSSAAIHALLQRGMVDQGRAEELTIRAIAFLAHGTDGACVVTVKISNYLKSSP